MGEMEIMSYFLRGRHKLWGSLALGFFLASITLATALAEPPAPPDGAKWNNSCHQQDQTLSICCEYNRHVCAAGCNGEQSCIEACYGAEKTCVDLGIATRGGNT